MEKFIKIKFANGSVWGIPLKQVADHRAKYYAEKDKDTTYQEEFDFVMRDDYEGLDWYRNNMNWDEVLAQQLVPPKEFKPEEHLDDDSTEYELE